MIAEDEKWYRVTLRFFGDRLDIKQIGPALQLEPTAMGRKGEHIRGNPRYAKHSTDVWIYTYPSDSCVPFEEQIDGLLRHLEPRHQVLREILSAPETWAELFLGFGSGNGQGGAFFSSGLLSRMSALDLNLQFDFYPADADDARGTKPDLFSIS